MLLMKNYLFFWKHKNSVIAQRNCHSVQTAHDCNPYSDRLWQTPSFASNSTVTYIRISQCLYKSCCGKTLELILYIVVGLYSAMIQDFQIIINTFFIFFRNSYVRFKYSDCKAVKWFRFRIVKDNCNTVFLHLKFNSIQYSYICSVYWIIPAHVSINYMYKIPKLYTVSYTSIISFVWLA